MSATKTAKQLDEKQKKLAPDAVTVPVTRGADWDKSDRYANEPAEQFRTDGLTVEDKKGDEVSKAKLAIGDAQGQTPFGKTELTEHDVDFVRRKMEATEAANFQQWFAQNFDLMSPADKAVARRLFPEFYKQRQALLKRQAQAAQDIARIKLTGPENFSDLQTLYLLEQGRLDLGPLKDFVQPKADSETRFANGFRRGILNPFRAQGKAPDTVEQRSKNAKKWNNSTLDLGQMQGFGRGVFPFPNENQGGKTVLQDTLSSTMQDIQQEL